MTINVTDTTPPTFTVIANQTIVNGTALAYDINATDASGISCFTVNDTTNFKINCSGYLENNTFLNFLFYNLNITFNYTLGNDNSALMWVNVTLPPNLSISFSSSTPKSGDFFVTQTYLPINVSFVGDNVIIYLYNSTKGLINSSTGTSSPYFVNFTNLAGGIYYFNATTFSSSSSNSTETRNVLISVNGIGSIVLNNTKISDNLSGFSPENLHSKDKLGSAVTNIGDLDGDGVQDLAVGAFSDGKGAIYILFMNTNGTVKSNVKISEGLAGFNPDGLDRRTHFGMSIANIGDLDGDGVQDLAVGASYDKRSKGTVYILFMNTNGSVASHVVITGGLAGFSPSGLSSYDHFGSSITNI